MPPPWSWGPTDVGKTLWHGRFEDGPSKELLDFSVSLHFDKRLAPDDIAGSRAHVRGLVRGGVLNGEEAALVLAALDRVAVELADGTFAFEPSDEDVHTAIERRATQLAGDAGAKLHTGRSRNDQVATAFRLYVKRELHHVAELVLDLQRVLLERAEEAGPAYLPGYTHLQRAQPVLLAHHLLAHGWALGRDVDRLLASIERMDVCPLGAGALAGSSLPLDLDGVAHELGFASRFENSLDAVSDRDFVAEALFDLALLGVHLSRIGEEVVLWSTEEFGFLRLADAWSTGSSMLPQKKNPDIAELVRGKSGRLIGHLTGVLTMLKRPAASRRTTATCRRTRSRCSMPVDTLTLALPALSGLLATADLRLERMRDAADSPYVVATDLAELLVEGGTPFREAHAIVGALVRDSIERHVPLAELVEAHPALGVESLELLEPGVSVTRRSTPGGAGPGPVADQLRRFVAYLDGLADPDWLES